LFGALTLAGLTASLAHAQGATRADAAPTIEVVSSTLLDGVGVPLSEVPSNAQTLRAGDIQAQSPTNMADLLNQNIGSVSVSNGAGNPYQNDVNYRGFQATSLLGAPVGLSVYLDGVRMNEPFGSVVNWDLMPMNAVSSVQVLPGSNPMFGLNTLGGALVVNTKNGKDNAGTSLGVQAGSFGRKAFKLETGWVDAERNTDHFLAGNWDQQDGFREHSGSEVRQFFGKARWRGEGNKLEASMALADTALSGTQSLPLDMMGNPRSAYTWPDKIANKMGFLNLKGSRQLGENDRISGQIYYRKASAHNVNSNAELDDGCFDETTVSGLAMSGSTPKCASKAPNGTATNSVTSASALALGYGRWTSAINTSVVQSSTRQNTVGSAVQWSSFGALLGRSNAFTLGGSFSQSDIRYGQDTYLARLIDYQTVVTPNLNYGVTANGAPSASNPLNFTQLTNKLRGVNLDSTTRDWSLFFTDTLELSDKLKVSAAGSFNVSTVNQTGLSNQYLNDDGGNSWTNSTGLTYYNPSYVGAYKSNGLTAPIAAPTLDATHKYGPESSSLNGAHRYQRFNPALGFNYQLDARTGLFGGYSEAMRAPTSVELSCANPQSPCALPTGFNGDPDLLAVVARTVEFGGRGRWGEKSSWSAAVYDARLSNDIQFIAAPNSTTFGYFANVGQTERRGLELGVQTEVDRLFLSANLGHVQARYKSSFTTSGGQNVVSGNTIPGIPSTSFKLRAAYPFSPEWLLGANLMAVSGQYAHGNESNSDPTGKVAGYSVFNMDLHYQANKELKFTAHVNNLMNRSYSTYGLSGVTSIYTLAQQPFLTPAAPRALWLGLTYSFGGKATKS